MNNDPLVKPTPPNWKKVKTVDSDEVLKFKRMRAELVAAGYGPVRSIARWSKLKIVETYKKLEEVRAEHSNVLQKSVYPTTAALSPKIGTPKNLLSSSDLSESIANLVSRPQSPNSSSIILCPRKPTDPKIVKWKSCSNTQVLTLIRSNGSVEEIKMDSAYNLNAYDLQDLLDLQLERDDEEDMFSLDFELQFKGQIREMLMRNKNQ